MRAYRQGDKIIIKSNEEYAEIEALINSITNSLDVVRAACEDRNTEAFPSSTVGKMVEKIELLKTKGKEVFISRDFVEKIIESRDVYKYFEESLKRAQEEEKTFLKKMELYGKFADKLEETL